MIEILRNKVELPKIKCSTIGTGVLRLHNRKDMMIMIDAMINTLTHVDNGALMFNSSCDLIQCYDLVRMTMDN